MAGLLSVPIERQVRLLWIVVAALAACVGCLSYIEIARAWADRPAAIMARARQTAPPASRRPPHADPR